MGSLGRVGACLLFASVAAGGCAAITGVGDLVECAQGCDGGTDAAPIDGAQESQAPSDATDASDGTDASTTDARDATDAFAIDVNDATTAGCARASDCPVGQACNPATGQCSDACGGGLACNGGCCNGTTCQAGTANTQCGNTGGQCTDCAMSQNGTECVLGTCGCMNELQCPANEACRMGTCSTSCSGGLRCNGGCCDGATCQPGTGPLTCGANGEACSACPVGEACNAGTCSQVCTGGLICNGGCCNGTSCVGGIGNDQCGNTGGACSNCITTCSPGPECIPSAMLIGGTCGCTSSSQCLASNACAALGKNTCTSGACQ